MPTREETGDRLSAERRDADQETAKRLEGEARQARSVLESARRRATEVLRTGGLYIARRIVEAHGGRIWVESSIGRGARSISAFLSSPFFSLAQLQSSARSASHPLRSRPRLARLPFLLLAEEEMVLSARSAHCRSMPKTWVPKNDIKFEKAFAKAMRALIAPKGRRNAQYRPR